MKLSLANSKTTVNVSDDIFAREYNEDLVHQAVTAYLAGGRQGTKANKSRSDVRGGGGGEEGDRTGNFPWLSPAFQGTAAP